MNQRNLLKSFASFLVILLLVVGFAILRVRTMNRYAVQSAPDELSENGETKTPADPNSKPFFSLITNRTYGTTDQARLWVNYRGVEALDFRVYRVKDPVKFFKGLDNPHQVGEDEQATAGAQIKHKTSFLEKLLAFKKKYFAVVRDYVRGQLQNQSRKGFNQHFRASSGEEEEIRTPLNVSDYARVPLLNPDQMVKSWREKLPPLEDMYDRRKISLGKQEPGVYLIEAVNGDLRAFGIVIVTDLTLITKTSSDGQMTLIAADRKSGAPREGVHVEFDNGKDTVKTGDTAKDGIFKTKFDKPKTAAADEGDDEESSADDTSTTEEQPKKAFLIMANSGNNFAISDLDSFYFGNGGGDEEGDEGGGSSEDVTGYIYTDRPVYRPEQTVYFKGILRMLTENGYKMVPGKSVSVTVTDPNGGAIYQKDLALSSRGTMSGDLALPEETSLGTYQIQVLAGDLSASGSFEVEEYKKPEYKVTVSNGQKFVKSGDTAKFYVSAKYFFGSPVTHADVKYEIYRSRYYGWWGGDNSDTDTDDQQFGADPTQDDQSSDDSGGSDNMVKDSTGKLDAKGVLEVDFQVPKAAADDHWDYTYRLEAHVTDQSRRTMDGSASFVGIRANIVAEAAPELYVYHQGDQAKILVKSNDFDGKPVQTHVKLTFVERRWEKVTKKTEDGDEYPGYETKDRELSTAAVDTDSQGQGSVMFAVPISGAIHIKTTIQDNGQDFTSEGGSIWAADPGNAFSDYSYEEDTAIKMIPDKKTYKPGETAHVLVLLPKAGAHLFVTTELLTVMGDVKQYDVSGRSIIIDQKIDPKFAPDVFLNVTYIKNGEMNTLDQMISVPARDKLLKLDVIPDKKEYKPREPVSYTILARNADGAPVSGAEVSLGVVDESIYSIAAESVQDIRRVFYGQRYNSVTTNVSTNYFFTGYAGKKVVNLAQNRRSFQLADFKNDSPLVNPLIRKIFKDTAAWQPNVLTGADGKATVKVDLPDNLTTWRATARAVTTDTKVGVAVSKVVERKDVIIRMAMPRFVTQGDTVTLSGIVHNYLKSDKNTKISIQVDGAQLQDKAEQTVTIPSQGEYRVDWKISASQTGDLKILAKALTDTESDALETGIQIVPRGLKQTTGETVTISDDDGAKDINYNFAANVDTNSRSLRIEVSPSIAGTLFGALDYLTAFPYGCTEQTMSAFLPTVIVKQTLKNVQTASIKDTNDIDKKARIGLRRLYNYQHDDGGWGWWKDDPTDPYMTAYVVDGMTLAKKAGYQIDDSKLDKGREKLKAMIDSGKLDDGKAIDPESRAYMIFALSESGGSDPKYVNDLFTNRAGVQPYGRALLALALEARGDEKKAQTVAGEIEGSATNGGGGAFWPSRYRSFGMDQPDDVEATALSLKALSHLSPKSPLLPKAARWLVGSRKYGAYWQSTKETAFAIYGLTDYLKVSQELTPDYSVELFINGQSVLTKQMTGADATSAQSVVILKKGNDVPNSTQVKVVKHGHGVLYLMTTIITNTNDDNVAAQSSQQLKLARDYLRLKIVDGDDGQPTWKTEPLSGDLHSGDLIVSRLYIEGAAGRYLMVEDPIPAGCEQVENASGIDLDSSTKDWTDWYSSREFRDNRTVFFLNYFSGKATYQYAMRVQVPGQFRIAPARVEQMYQPSIQSNTTNGRLTILDN